MRQAVTVGAKRLELPATPLPPLQPNEVLSEVVASGVCASELHGVQSILGYHQGGPRSADMQLWSFKAIEVVNAHERRTDHRMDCMRRGLALAAAGKLDLAALTTHRFPLEQVGDAFAARESKLSGFIKSIVLPSKH